MNAQFLCYIVSMVLAVRFCGGGLSTPLLAGRSDFNGAQVDNTPKILRGASILMAAVKHKLMKDDYFISNYSCLDCRWAKSGSDYILKIRFPVNEEGFIDTVEPLTRGQVQVTFHSDTRTISDLSLCDLKEVTGELFMSDTESDGMTIDAHRMQSNFSQTLDELKKLLEPQNKLPVPVRLNQAG